MTELAFVSVPDLPGDEQEILFPLTSDDFASLWQSGDNTSHFCEITDHLDLGIAMLDFRGHVLCANRVARAMLSDGDGVRYAGQRFSACSASAATSLDSAMAEISARHRDPAGERPSPQAFMVPRAGRAALTVGIFPSARRGNRHDDAWVTAAVVLISDPDMRFDESIRLSCELYGLTPTETRLSSLLIDGLTLSEAAVAMNLSPATVRSYLKQVFAKTGVHRQASLIRLLMGSRLPIIAPLVQRMARPAR